MRCRTAVLWGLLLVVRANAAVTVDAVENCFELNFRRTATTMTLDPGRFTVTITDAGSGVRWGTSERLKNLRTRHVLVDLDPADCSVWDEPVASLCYNDATWGHFSAEPIFTVHRTTDIHLYLVDSVVDGNAGSVTVDVQRVNQDNMAERTVGSRTLRAVENCYQLNFVKARQTTVEPGYYRLEVLRGNLRYGAVERYGDRLCANVLIDCNPADVRMQYLDPNVDAMEPVAAISLATRGEVVWIKAVRRTTLNFYLTDFKVAGNAGEVVISVKPVETPY